METLETQDPEWKATDSQITTQKEKPEASDAPIPPSFPEGGLEGWLVVLGCFCVMFTTFGYINAFGVYQAYYKQTFLHAQSDSNIAWIGSLQLFFMFSAGIVSGPCMDRFGPRIILIPFSALYVLSIMLTSLCTQYYQFVLAQGLLGGLANGVVYTPAVSAVGQYFLRKRPLAMGIASTGSSLAGVVLPLALNRMLFHSTLGFGWTVRIIGFVMLVLCTVSCCTVKSRTPRRSRGPLFLLEAWQKPSFTCQVIGFFIVIWGLFVPFFYVPVYAESIGIGVDFSYDLISILNAASMVGRLLAGALANPLGRFNVLFGSISICSILSLCWLRISTQPGLIAFSVLYGFFSGAAIGLFPATVAMTAPQPDQIGAYMGMALGTCSFAGLTGTPISGALVSRYGFHAAFIFAGLSTVLGGALVYCAKIFHAGGSLFGRG